jgi:hypothetical protein
VCHEYIYNTLRCGKSISTTQLCGKGYTTPKLSIERPLKRKVFIRKLEDIRLLNPNEDYGIPIIPNFPLIDALIGPDILFQMTVSEVHKGAIDKLDPLVDELQAMIKNNMGSNRDMVAAAPPKMVFVLSYENFDKFKKVRDISIHQYKLQYNVGRDAAPKRQHEDDANSSNRSIKQRKGSK